MVVQMYKHLFKSNLMKNTVVLINEEDKVIGLMDKMEAHKRGILHRAFSVFIFDYEGNILLQKRADCKYHSPSLWTNACCSHPKLNETYLQAAQRRLKEEINIESELEYQFNFIYKAYVGQGLIEHELDHVFFGFYDGVITPNADEVSDYKYLSLAELIYEVETRPEQFTEWFTRQN